MAKAKPPTPASRAAGVLPSSPDHMRLRVAKITVEGLDVEASGAVIGALGVLMLACARTLDERHGGAAG